MNFNQYYDAYNTRVDSVNKFYIDIIGFFGLVQINPNSTILRQFFKECRTVVFNNVKSTDPELIIISDKLYHLGFLRTPTMKRICGLYLPLKYQTVESIATSEILEIILEVNDNMIAPDPFLRSFLNDFREGKIDLKDSVKELWRLTRKMPDFDCEFLRFAKMMHRS